MKHCFFIAGTDTGVGTTYVAARMIEQISKKIGWVAYLKPFQTGCVMDCGGRFTTPDADHVKAKLGERVDCHVLYQYKMPAAPLAASRAAGEEIDFDAAVKWVENRAEEYEAVVVEGAGGLLVPITDDKTILDYAEGLGYPVVLVAANRLGCINHTLLSIEAMNNRGMKIDRIVLSDIEPGEPDAVMKSNADMIRTFADGIELVELSYDGTFPLDI
jgi:adenosylmethionine-8-amino-7-oxononanoate aminotransferase